MRSRGFGIVRKYLFKAKFKTHISCDNDSIFELITYLQIFVQQDKGNSIYFITIMPLVQDYIKLSNKWKMIWIKTCVLMQCGCFEMYGLRNKDDSISDVTDVEELANVCDISG